MLQLYTIKFFGIDCSLKARVLSYIWRHAAYLLWKDVWHWSHKRFGLEACKQCIHVRMVSTPLCLVCTQGLQRSCRESRINNASSIAWTAKLEICLPQGLQAWSAYVEPARGRIGTQYLMASREKQCEITKTRDKGFYKCEENYLASLPSAGDKRTQNRQSSS